MSKRLTELNARLTDLKKEGLAIVNKAEEENREFTGDEETRMSEIEAAVKEANDEVAAITRRDEARRSMDAVNVGGSGSGSGSGSPYGANMVDDLDPAATGGFKDIAEFAVSVQQACAPGAIPDPRLASLAVGGNAPGINRQHAAPTNFHTGGGGSGEGFSVPTQFREAIFSVMEGVDEFGPIVDEEPTAARRVGMLANEETPWGASGVQANWRSEGTQMSPSKMDDDDRSVALHEIYAFILATGELLDDAPRMASRLTTRAGQALAWKKNSAMMRGTGSGQPLGWLNSGALITVAKEAGQSADTIVAANVLNMFTRLAVVPGDSPRWLANRNIIPQLATMTIGDQPVWMPPSGLAAAPGGFLLGLPVMLTEHASTLGDLGDIQLMSGRGYYSLRRDGGPQFASSIHLFFDYNIEAFRWMTRFGGQPHLSAPIEAPTEGGGAANSKSHFVALAERA